MEALGIFYQHFAFHATTHSRSLFKTAKMPKIKDLFADMKMWNVLNMICNDHQSKYGSINHLSPPCAKLFLCRIFDMNVCQKMCQMHSASVMGGQLSVLDFRWCIRLAGCLVGRWFNHQLVGYKWWQVQKWIPSPCECVSKWGPKRSSKDLTIKAIMLKNSFPVVGLVPKKLPRC